MIRTTKSALKKMLGGKLPEEMEKAKTPQAPSEGEDALDSHLRHYNIPFMRQFRFNPKREWRADFWLLNTKVLCEVEGGHWKNGAHQRALRFAADCIKYNCAQRMGFIVLRYTTDQVTNGMAIDEICNFLGIKR